MANVSEIVMTVKSITHPGTVVHLTQLKVSIIFWLAQGFTYKDLELKLNKSNGRIHGVINELYEESFTCNEASLINWAHLNRVLIEQNGKAVLNKDLVVIKESG